MKQIVSAILLCSALVFSSCAVLTGSRNIAVAENYVKSKHYPAAVEAYRAILQDYPDSLYASDARYGLGMAHVAFDNPQKDYAQALQEFEAFVKLAPDDGRVPNAQNWISALRTLNNLNKSIEQLKRLDIRHEERRRK